MHDLEQAALDDTFLADAIEGLIQHPDPTQDLSDLHDRLYKKVSQDTRRTAILLIRLRITVAAAVILLLGIGYTFFHRYSNQPQQTPQPAAAAAAKALQPAAPATEFKAATDNADSVGLAITQPRSESKGRGKSLPITHKTASISRSAPPVALFNRSAPQSTPQSAPIPDSAKLSADLRQTIAARTEDKEAIHHIPLTDPIVYSGKVFDINNRPLAGAALNLKGSLPLGTVTDNEGFFRLSVPRADTTLRLTVSMVGYNQASLALNYLDAEARSNNVIYLKPSNAALDEVVVAGYGAKRKATQVAAPSTSNERLDTLWIRATPVIGRQAYLQYLNLSKNKLGLDSTITGTETVSFIVSSDGSLSSFKIEQSLSPAHDNSLIRLVMDGPAWRLLRGKKVRAAVTMNF